VTTDDLAFIFIIVITCLAAIACWIVNRVSYADGWNDCLMQQANRRNERQITLNRAAGRPPAASPAGGHPPWADPWAASVTAVRVAHGGACGPSTIPISRPRLMLPASVTTTGELERLTDEYIERVRAEEDVFRCQMREKIHA